MPLTVLFYIFMTVTILEISYFCFAVYSIRSMPLQLKKSNTAISLLLYTKNQAELIKTQLPVFLKQKHKNFEIVLINDASSDDTLEIMKRFQNENSKIKVIDVKNIEAFWGSKKYALTLAIKAASHERLVISSIDHKPNSTGWLQHIAAALKEKSFIIGLRKYTSKNTLFYRFFNFRELVKSCTLSKMGIVYGGTSANVSYTKTLFYSASGFAKHMQLPFGETKLFANEVSKLSNTAICLQHDSGVTQLHKPKFGTWLKEQVEEDLILRHSRKLVLLSNRFLFLCRLVFYILAVVLMIISEPETKPLVIILLSGRFAIQYICYGIIANKLKELKLIIALPFLDLWSLILQFVIFISGFKSKQPHWN